MTVPATPIYCANHPTVETTLRCSRCNKPICPKCAIKSPVGYRCPECVKSQQKIFDTAVWSDYVLGSVVAVILSVIASFLISLLGSIGFFGWILVAAGAPTAGIVIAEGVRFVWREKLILSAMSLDLLAVFFGGAVALLPIYATDILHIGATAMRFASCTLPNRSGSNRRLMVFSFFRVSRCPGRS